MAHPTRRGHAAALRHYDLLHGLACFSPTRNEGRSGSPPFKGEGGFKKIVFYTSEPVISMKTQKGMSKTKLKTSCFLTQMTRNKPRFGCFLTKRTQSILPAALRRGREPAFLRLRKNGASENMKNRGNEAKKWLKIKEITFSKGANRVRFARNFAQIWREMEQKQRILRTSRSCPSAGEHPETTKHPGARASCPQLAWNRGAEAGRMFAFRGDFKAALFGERRSSIPVERPGGTATRSRPYNL